MMHSIKTLFCILAFVMLSRAETWEDTITVHLNDYSYFAFENQGIVVPLSDRSIDVFIEGSCIASSWDESCFYYLSLTYGRSQDGSIWMIKDTTALEFHTTLDLSDTSTFTAQGTSVELDSGIYGFEQYFILLLGSGKYAFCHGTIKNNDGDVTMPLACQVQEDGTPTFDSIPQYKEPPVALPPLRQSTIQKRSTPSAPYRVNGTSASTSTAIGIRVGKDTAIRDQ